jgi:two-component system phosphate regulon response regulator PhoB
MEGLAVNQAEAGSDQSPAVTNATSLSLGDGREGHRILIIEQDSEMREPLQTKLAQAGFTVITLKLGEDAAAVIDRDNPHLVMLDWDLPGVVAMDLLRHVRREALSRKPRLIALSAYSGEQQVVAGLELGLDDYVAKPFSAREVVARVRAVLRPLTGSRDHAEYLEFQCIRMDAGEGRVTIRDRTVSLRTMEFRLLEFLMRHPERAFQREHLLRSVWGRDCRAELRAVDVTVQRIRRALVPHKCDTYLQTIRAVGYRLSASGAPRTPAAVNHAP